MTTWIQYLLNEEENKVAKRSTELLRIPSEEVGENEYQYLFADLDEKSTRPRTCLPMGIDLTHYLLVSGKSVCIDLTPCTDEEFERRYRIHTDTARQLVKIGRLFINIWDTRPESWVNTGKEVRQLVESAGFVNWYRVRKFFQLVCPNFDEHIETRTRQIQVASKFLGSSDYNELTIVAQVKEPTEVPLVTGRRWAYLDAVNSYSANQAEWYLKRGQWKEFIEFVRGATLLQTSRFSGAYGTNFIWGPDHLSVISDSQEWLTERIRKEKGFAGDRRALEFMLHELTKVPPFQVLDLVESHRLIRFIEDEDNSKLCEKIFDASEILSELVLQTHDKDLDGLDFNAYKEFVSELQQKYRRFMVGTKTGGKLIEYSVGLLLPLLGFIGGLIIGGSIVILKNVFRGEFPKVESKLYDLYDPSSRKVITTLEELQRKSNDL